MTQRITNAVFPQITNTVTKLIFPLKELRVRENSAEILSLREEYLRLLTEVQSEYVQLRNSFGLRVYDNKRSEVGLHLWDSARSTTFPNQNLRWRIKSNIGPARVVYVNTLLLSALSSNNQNSLIVSDMFAKLQSAKKLNGSHLLDEVLETESKRIEMNARYQLFRSTIDEIDKLLLHTKMVEEKLR